MKNYDPKTIESKWQQIWAETGLYKTETDKNKPYYYNLTMFPYPSGDLHTGHWYALTAPDVLARFHRRLGKNVLFPMGWDAFGLPAENAAIKRNIQPAEWTRSNIASMKAQLGRMGASFDWSKELSTASPDYYRWTQQLFLLMHEKGLAYREKGLQNWCPSCQTVLANEQVVGENHVCERCGTPVEKKELEQWFFKITDYADRLLEDLDTIDWPQKVKTMQANWIGRSEGARISFTLVDHDDSSVEIYTTRPDTLFGATYMVLAPEHPLVDEIAGEDNRKAIETYRRKAAQISDVERMSEREKTGVFTGAYALNPINGEKLPIWVADYVLMGYGTGAIMAVPAHDERDHKFATAFDLPIVAVVEGESGADLPYAGEGKLVNSGSYDGMTSEKGREAIVKALEEQGVGTATTQYKLRDWLISRQRYWGPPIPIIYCDECGVVPVPEDQLPVLLPEDVEFEPTGRSPLVERDDFVQTECPTCAAPARREVDTIDTFVDSSWYYLRYPNPNYTDGMFDPEAVQRWLPVDHYMGGIEHAILHLLYSRFVTKVLHDHAGLEFSEPFQKLSNQGMILGPDSQKMSKSRGNVINPDDVIDSGYGADAFRTHMLFIGPWTDGGPFTTEGLAGTFRFINRIWRLTNDYLEESAIEAIDNKSALETRMQAQIHKTIRKVTRDVENLGFNTAIAALMEFTNYLYKQKEVFPPDSKNPVWKEAIEAMLMLFAPFAPHVTEELWSQLGYEKSIHVQGWPVLDESLLAEEMANVVIQVNGKLRDEVVVPADIDEQKLEDLARGQEKITPYLEEGEVVKVIVVPGRLVNFVVK